MEKPGPDAPLDGTPGLGVTPTDIPPRKRPYERPAFRFEGVFETSALACGKANSHQGQCQFNRKTS